MGRSVAFATLAGVLAWAPPTFAYEADSETRDAPAQKFVDHTVERGETVWEIADRYGTSVASVIRENEIDDPTAIWVGVRLRIPIPVGANPIRDSDERIGGENFEATGVGELLDRCEAELRAAHFEEALASAGEARDRIAARDGSVDDADRVRLEIASATAYVALGQNEAALESLERALIADPNLELDPALTSPKVLAVFRVARGRATPTD
jgi:LysM repeat protein